MCASGDHLLQQDNNDVISVCYPNNHKKAKGIKERTVNIVLELVQLFNYF
jgi:hypothetical protein